MPDTQQIAVHGNLMVESRKFRPSRRSARHLNASSPSETTESDEDMSSLSSTGPLSPHSEDSDTNSTVSSNRNYDGVPEIEHLQSINEEESIGPPLVIKPDSEHMNPVQLSRWQSSEIQPIWSNREEVQLPVEEAYFSGGYSDGNSEALWPETEQCGNLPDFTTGSLSPTVVSDNFDDRDSSGSFSTALGSSSNNSSMDSMDQSFGETDFADSPSPSFLDFNCSDTDGAFQFDPYRVDTMAMGQGMEAAINAVGRADVNSNNNRRTSQRLVHSKNENEDDYEEDEEDGKTNIANNKSKAQETKSRSRVSKSKSSKTKKTKGSTKGSKARKDSCKTNGSNGHEEDIDPPTLTITEEQRKMLEEMGESSDEELVPGQPRRIGAYTLEERKVRINRFLEKRKRRCWEKKVIRYQSRKRQATKRPRVNGRFVRTDELEDYYRQHPEERPLPEMETEAEDKEERLMINTSQLGIPTHEVMTPPESPSSMKNTVSPAGQPNAHGMQGTGNPPSLNQAMKGYSIPQVLRSVSNDSTDVESRGRSGSDSSQNSEEGWRTIPEGAVASTSLQDVQAEPLVYRSMGAVDMAAAENSSAVVSHQPRPLLTVSTAKVVGAASDQPLTPTTKLARHMSKSLSMEHEAVEMAEAEEEVEGSEGAMDMEDDESEPMHQVMKRCLSEGELGREEQAPILKHQYGVTESALRIACCNVGENELQAHQTTYQQSASTQKSSSNPGAAKDGTGVCSSLWNSVVGSFCSS